MSKRPPASIRNRNPGAMEPGWASKKFGSTSYETLRWRDKAGNARTNRCATFPTDQHGGAAMFALLASKSYTGRPIKDAIKKWCGGYSAPTYLKILQSKAGVDGDTLLTAELVHDAQWSIPLVRAMAFQEAGRNYPMTDDDWHQAHRMAFFGALAPEWTPDNDVPTQKHEARVREAKTTAAGATVAGGAVVGVAEVADKVSPPDLSLVTAWQSVVQTGASLAEWATSNVAMLGIAIAAAGAVWIWRTRE